MNYGIFQKGNRYIVKPKNTSGQSFREKITSKINRGRNQLPIQANAYGIRKQRDNYYAANPLKREPISDERQALADQLDFMRARQGIIKPVGSNDYDGFLGYVDGQLMTFPSESDAITAGATGIEPNYKLYPQG